MSEQFDAIIIGAGQAGGPLAHRLADQGWEVALIEREFLGGSCINYGCTPTKKMLSSARVAHMARRAPEYGVQTGEIGVDLAQVVAMKDRLVEEWRDGQQEQADSRPNLRLIRGEASFSGPHMIQVSGETYQSERIFINTGSRADIPAIEGIENVPYLTNRSILRLTDLPDHLLIIGGGYIGLEFAQMFRRFGSQVTVVQYAGQIMEREDEDIAEALQEVLEGEGIQFLLSAQAESVSYSEKGGFRVRIIRRDREEQVELSGSHLLLAAGNRPNSDALNLEAAGIVHENGWIEVNEYLETNVPNVYALGDVKGGPAFTHISYNDYMIIYHNLFHKEKKSIKERLVPYALYTDPELGRVGMTERDARESGRPVKVGRIPMRHVARAVERDETAGLMKIVVDAETECVLGAAILGVEGGELVQTLMTLMLTGASWKVLQGAIFIHPTLTEGFFGLIDSIE